MHIMNKNASELPGLNLFDVDFTLSAVLLLSVKLFVKGPEFSLKLVLRILHPQDSETV